MAARRRTGTRDRQPALRQTRLRDRQHPDRKARLNSRMAGLELPTVRFLATIGATPQASGSATTRAWHQARARPVGRRPADDPRDLHGARLASRRHRPVLRPSPPPSRTALTTLSNSRHDGCKETRSSPILLRGEGIYVRGRVFQCGYSADGAVMRAWSSSCGTSGRSHGRNSWAASYVKWQPVVRRYITRHGGATALRWRSAWRSSLPSRRSAR